MKPKKIKFKSYEQLKKLKQPYLLEVENTIGMFIKLRLVDVQSNTIQWDSVVYTEDYDIGFEESCYYNRLFPYEQNIHRMKEYDYNTGNIVATIILL